jgi:predicted porin
VKTFTLKSTALAVSALLAATLAHGQAQPVTPDPGKLEMTWYGIADVSIVSADSGFGSKTRIEGGGGMIASRLGVRANRTFADGIRALAVLEAGVGWDNGDIGNANQPPGTNVTAASSGGLLGTGPRIFSRQSYAGIGGDFGTVTIGRHYTGSYIAIAGIGSAWGDGLYANPAALLPSVGGMPTRWDNSLVYQTPVVAGFSGYFTYTAGAEHNISVPAGTGAATITDKSGVGYDIYLKYKAGPLTAAASAWSFKNGSYNATGGETGLATKSGGQLVANYDFGVAYVAAAYVSGTIKDGNYENVTKAFSKGDGWGLSARFPFGEGNRHNFFIGYTELKDKSLLQRTAKLGGGAYWYQLEAQTKLYVSYGQLSNSANASFAMIDGGNLVGNVATPGFKPKALELGIVYNF